MNLYIFKHPLKLDVYPQFKLFWSVDVVQYPEKAASLSAYFMCLIRNISGEFIHELLCLVRTVHLWQVDTQSELRRLYTSVIQHVEH